MAKLGDWEFSANRYETIKAYEAVANGGSESCDCSACRNFVPARETVFPSSFLTLLDKLGIDPSKDGEIYHVARMSPGLHEYAGWYHFVGSLNQSGDFAPAYLEEGFSVWMSRPNAPRLPSLKEKPVVQLEFRSESVPWLLSEPEPE
ncbi:MAG: hypothetical protein PVI23_06585 [Maricaulaceae bacterium]|jgi:hypothetical protein